MVTYLLAAALASTQPQAEFIGTYRREYATESSTADFNVAQDLALAIKNLFVLGAQETFQDGMASQFGTGLVSILRRRGPAALRALVEFIDTYQPSPDVVSEALRWLADYDEQASFAQRFFILREALNSPSPRVRDGAVVGLAALDDPQAIDPLSEARRDEQIDELRRLMDSAIDQLQRQR